MAKMAQDPAKEGARREIVSVKDCASVRAFAPSARMESSNCRKADWIAMSTAVGGGTSVPKDW